MVESVFETCVVESFKPSVVLTDVVDSGVVSDVLGVVESLVEASVVTSV